VAFGWNTDAVEKGEPEVAEGCVFGQDDVFAELDVRAASGDDGGTVV
jgi:predicted transcriptional regulator